MKSPFSKPCQLTEKERDREMGSDIQKMLKSLEAVRKCKNSNCVLEKIWQSQIWLFLQICAEGQLHCTTAYGFQ